MKLSFITLSTSLFLAASQATLYVTDPSLRICHDYAIPVNVTNVALKASYEPFTSNYDVADFVNGLAGRDTAASLNLFSGPRNVTGVYNIGATICSPKKRTKKQNTILLASHGLGYDRR